MQFDGSLPNTYTGTTTVNDGSLLLNKTGGGAMSGPLTIGDGVLSGNVQAGGLAGSDVVRELQANQLPDYQALVTVGSTGLLDLNGNNDTIGTADGQTALTVIGGAVTTGTGTLTLNGDISVLSAATVGGLPGNPAAAIAPTISGNLAFPGSFAASDHGSR